MAGRGVGFSFLTPVTKRLNVVTAAESRRGIALLITSVVTERLGIIAAAESRRDIGLLVTSAVTERLHVIAAAEGRRDIALLIGLGVAVNGHAQKRSPDEEFQYTHKPDINHALRVASSQSVPVSEIRKRKRRQISEHISIPFFRGRRVRVAKEFLGRHNGAGFL